jgi:hypothetical protein
MWAALQQAARLLLHPKVARRYPRHLYSSDDVANSIRQEHLALEPLDDQFDSKFRFDLDDYMHSF